MTTNDLMVVSKGGGGGGKGKQIFKHSQANACKGGTKEASLKQLFIHFSFVTAKLLITQQNETFFLNICMSRREARLRNSLSIVYVIKM